MPAEDLDTPSPVGKPELLERGEDHVAEKGGLDAEDDCSKEEAVVAGFQQEAGGATQSSAESADKLLDLMDARDAKKKLQAKTQKAQAKAEAEAKKKLEAQAKAEAQAKVEAKFTALAKVSSEAAAVGTETQEPVAKAANPSEGGEEVAKAASPGKRTKRARPQAAAKPEAPVVAGK